MFHLQDGVQKKLQRNQKVKKTSLVPLGGAGDRRSWRRVHNKGRKDRNWSRGLGSVYVKNDGTIKQKRREVGFLVSGAFSQTGASGSAYATGTWGGKGISKHQGLGFKTIRENILSKGPPGVARAKGAVRERKGLERIKSAQRRSGRHATWYEKHMGRRVTTKQVCKKD